MILRWIKLLVRNQLNNYVLTFIKNVNLKQLYIFKQKFKKNKKNLKK